MSPPGFAGGVLMLVGCLLYSSGAIDLLLVAAFWLRTGSWEALRTSEFLVRHLGASDLRSWLENPTDWIGLHTAVDALFLRWPAYAVGIISGLALWASGFSVVLQASEMVESSEAR
jgi:hypothetical protein